MKTTVIAVSTTKGGTGKTTTAVHLAAGLAFKMENEGSDESVVLIDLDPQGNAADFLGVQSQVLSPANPDGACISRVLMGERAALESLIEIRDNLFLLPASEELKGIIQYLIGQDITAQYAGLQANGRKIAGYVPLDDALTERLRPLLGRVPFIIIDCPPNPGRLETAIARFADFVISPVQLQYLSVTGVALFARTLSDLRQTAAGQAQLLYILPCMTSTLSADGTPFQVAEREMLGQLQEAFGKKVLSPVTLSAAVKEAPALHLTVYEHAPSSQAARAYGRLVEKVYARV